MLQQIQQAVASNVDGIATYGFAGEDATGPVVKRAYDRGMIFTTLNGFLKAKKNTLLKVLVLLEHQTTKQVLIWVLKQQKEQI